MKPAYRIQVNGNDAANDLLHRVSTITLHDEAGIKADTLEIEIDAGGDIDIPAAGTEIKLWLGYEPSPVYKGRFRVDRWTLSGPLQILRVNAVAADLTTKIKATKTRSHHDTTLGAIVNKIAGEHGLAVAMDDELAARKVEHIDQQTESDMGFLTRLALRNGATFKFGAGRIIFTAKGSKMMPDGSDKPVLTIQREQLTDWTVSVDERGGHKAVKCEYRDVKTGKRVMVEAGAGEPCHRDRKLYATRVEAEAAAKAKMGDLERSSLSVDISGPGIPELFAEGLVRLTGVHAAADGEYLAKSVEHTLSASGYAFSASLETAK